ncbi:hypothetical protein Baya_4594 [Bagarius yarrelli]|uniref:Uncharacterized protein n=1 Tax=Bagarius yarrelli TaxID=175774 RepID=A0A556TR74_BAGYA|nr:hypothetical protein Baya_4594 [Bagarius yarrelli]
MSRPKAAPRAYSPARPVASLRKARLLPVSFLAVRTAMSTRETAMAISMVIVDMRKILRGAIHHQDEAQRRISEAIGLPLGTTDM